MGGIVSQMLGRHHQEKMLGEARQADLHELAIKDGLTNPNSRYTPDEILWHSGEYAKLLHNKEAEKSFMDHMQQVVGAAKAAKQSAQQTQGAPNPSGGINQQGSPPGLPSPDAGMDANGPVSQAPSAVASFSQLPQRTTQNPTSAAAPQQAPAAAAPARPSPMLMDNAAADIQGTSGFGGAVAQAQPSASTVAPNLPIFNDPVVTARRQVEIDRPAAEFKTNEDIRKQRGLTEAQYDLYDKKFKQVSQFIKEQSQNSDPTSETEWTIAMDQNGMPSARQDRGTPLPQMYLGSQLPTGVVMIGGSPVDPTSTYTVLRYSNGKLKALANAPTLRTGGTIEGTATQYNPRIPGSAEAAGVVNPALASPRTFNLQGGGVGIASPGQIAAGGLPQPVPGSLGTGDPTITNRQQVVDLGDRKVVENLTNTSQRGRGVVAPNGSLPAPSSATPVHGTGVSGRTLEKGLSPNQQMKTVNAITVPAKIIFGDKNDPSFKPLASYSSLADNKDSRDRIGQAFRLILDAGGKSGAEHLGASVGPINVSAGTVGELLSYKMGVPQAVAKAKVQAIQGILSEMEQKHPEEIDYLNQVFNSIPAITAMRSITSGSAFKWSQESLERELPMIGVGAVTGSRAYKQKLANLGNELTTAAANIPGKPIDPNLIETIRKGGLDSGITAPGVTPPSSNFKPAAMLGGKPIGLNSDGTKWVYADGTEVK